MRRLATLLTALAVVALAFGPALSEARPGGGVSSGSRGSRTDFAPPSTQTAPGTTRQFDRTETAPARPAPAPGVTQPGAPRPATSGGFFSRNPLMTGLMGGLLGAGLFGLLSGSGLFGGMDGFAGFLGLLLQIALIGGIVWLVLRLVRGNRRPQPALAASPAGAAGATLLARDLQPGQPASRSMGGAVTAPVNSRPIEITEPDYNGFEKALLAINAAWSRQDIEALRKFATPEMTNYFAQDLADLRARGWTNTTSDVQLEAGDLAEAWQENGQDFATVAMRFSLIDVTRDANGSVTEGNPKQRQTVAEVWTFTRYPGEAWRLSAIQQTN
jgi:predicted lipid-binding transport protein (Tim44 family)